MKANISEERSHQESLNTCSRRRASYFHLQLTDICGSCNELDVLKPHLCFDGASVVAFFETVVRPLDRNGVVDGRFVRQDNKTVLPSGPYTSPEVVFDEVTVALDGVAILC
jgi:hypothetical protein